MKEIPTAEEFWEENNFSARERYDFNQIDYSSIYLFAIKFAKLHVQAQREAIKKKATIKKRYDGNIAKEYWEDIVDEQSIDNAYDLNNIK